MEYVGRKMKPEATDKRTIDDAMADTAYIYEAMTYAQDFTVWDDVNGDSSQALALEVV